MSAPRLLKGAPTRQFERTFLQDALLALQTNVEKNLIIDTRNGQKFTVGEVHQMASAICAKLKDLGIGHGDIVLLVTNATVEAYITLLGIWMTGAASSAINPLLPVEEIKMFFEICSCRVAYAGEAYIENVQKAGESLPYKLTFISPNGLDPVLDIHKIVNQPAELVKHVEQPLGMDHLIVVLFTSGTTGVPKGVRCTDGAVLFNAIVSFDIDLGKTGLLTSPLYWISSCISWTSALLLGNTILVTDRLKPQQILQVISEYKPSHWFTGPSALIDMCSVPDLDQYDTSSLDYVMVGGAVLFADHRRMINEKIFQNRNIVRACYGSTESGMVSLDNIRINPDSPQYASLGQACPGTIIKIVDTATGELVPPFVSGEICVKSPAIIKSYINKEITEDELDKEGFWHLGDIGYYDEEGFLFYQSRVKDVFKYKGQQIAPVELECIIQKHPDVIESAVVGKPSPEYGELPAAFVVLKPNSTLTEQELSDFVSKSVIDEKKLRGGIYFLESLPKSSVGKILRRDLVKTLSI